MFTIPCGASRLRSRLKHNIVDNTLLALSENLLRLHLKENPRLPDTVEELVAELVRRIPSDYDPSTLVERLPSLAALPVEERTTLKARLYDLYAGQFGPHVHAQNVARHWGDASATLSRWRSTRRAELSAARYSDFRTALLTFNATLNALPRGVWLP